MMKIFKEYNLKQRVFFISKICQQVYFDRFIGIVSAMVTIWV